MRTPIDRRELATQLQKLGQRGGLADEWRLEREAPLLLKLTERLLDLVSQPGDDTRPEEPAEEQQLKPDERPVTVRALCVRTYVSRALLGHEAKWLNTLDSRALAEQSRVIDPKKLMWTYNMI